MRVPSTPAESPATPQLDLGRFFGDAAPARVVGGVQLSEAVYGPRARLPRHAHTAPYLSFVVSGSYVETVGARQLACESYRLRFHPADEEHADSFGAGGAVCLNVELTPAWEATLAALGIGREPLMVDGALGPAARLRDEMRRAAACALAVEEATTELLGACVAAQRIERAVRDSRALGRARDYIEAHAAPGGTVVGLRDVAAAAGVHATHLARLFRQRLRCTVTEYARVRRLVHAQRQLVDRPAWSLSRIAAESGFADHAHFTRSFRRAFQVTPSAFRRAVRAAMPRDA